MNHNAPAWSSEVVREVLLNPVYVGLGPFPALIDEEAWVCTASKCLRHESPQALVDSVITCFQRALGIPAPPCDQHVNAIRTDPDPRSALHHLLADLRLACTVTPGALDERKMTDEKRHTYTTDGVHCYSGWRYKVEPAMATS